MYLYIITTLFYQVGPGEMQLPLFFNKSLDKIGTLKVATTTNNQHLDKNLKQANKKIKT